MISSRAVLLLLYNANENSWQCHLPRASCPCEDDDWNDPLRLLLVFAEPGVQGDLAIVKGIPFASGDLFCVNVDRLVSDLYLEIRVGLEVEVPVGVRVGAAL